MDSQTWSATFAGLSALAAVATAGVAAWSLLGSRQDSRDRTRPLVVASFRAGPSFADGYLYLVIANTGASTARNVKVLFSPKLDPGDDAVAQHIPLRYDHRIEVFPAGERYANIWAHVPSGSPFPDKVEVSVGYFDDHGRPFSDTFKLDVNTIGPETTATPSGDNVDKRLARGTEATAWELWRTR